MRSRTAYVFALWGSFHGGGWKRKDKGPFVLSARGGGENPMAVFVETYYVGWGEAKRTEDVAAVLLLCVGERRHVFSLSSLG